MKSGGVGGRSVTLAALIKPRRPTLPDADARRVPDLRANPNARGAELV